jgi:hypothetical protein
MTHYLSTDEVEEAISAIEMVSESVAGAKVDIYRWKWALIALHSAVQGFMVLALRGSNGLAVLKDDVAAAWLDAYDKNLPLPEERLDSYENLYKKAKGDRMLIYGHSRKFVPNGSQGGSINKLKDLRDDFIHFVPKGWSLEVSGLPRIFADCLDFIEFLGWECGNVLWHEVALESRAKVAIGSARAAIAEAKALYGV